MNLTAARFAIIPIVVLLASSFAVEAQPAGRLYRIGVLSDTRPVRPEVLALFTNPLRELGYVEGQNLVMEYRFASEHFELLPKLAEELVHLNVDVIATVSTAPAVAAKSVTRTIPIVTASSDYAGTGLAKSFRRPDANVTGVYVPIAELAGKRLQLLKEIVPTLSRVAVLSNPNTQATAAQLREVRAAARTLGISVQPVDVRNGDDFAKAFAEIRAARLDGLLALQDPVTFIHLRQIAEFGLKMQLPTSHAYQEFTGAGGLMSYGISFAGLARSIAVYVDKILKGARPEDLPIEQPAKFELVINMATARSLGLKIPSSLLLNADKVIE